jgi:hypothetical protein
MLGKHLRLSGVSIFIAEPNSEELAAQVESQVLLGLTSELLVEVLRVGIFEGDSAVIRFILGGNC